VRRPPSTALAPRSQTERMDAQDMTGLVASTPAEMRFRRALAA
jgi:hypothetical protein